jgi:hypothetical protein
MKIDQQKVICDAFATMCAMYHQSQFAENKKVTHDVWLLLKAFQYRYEKAYGKLPLYFPGSRLVHSDAWKPLDKKRKRKSK